MSTPTVEIGGSQEKLAGVLLASDRAVTLTQDGQPVGTFIPAHQKTNDEALASFTRTTDAIHAEMARLGVTEDEFVADFDQLLAQERTQGGPRP
jgi:antitoxin (DNA-binding transcriptional repressor) of toxin-antitoxin stability system